MPKSLNQITHSHLRLLLKRGDWVIDATLGNGKDALFLSECVGEEGRIIGFDIQEQAILKTQSLFEENKQSSHNLEIHQIGHENLHQIPLKRKVKAIVFNLGYLPNGDKSLTTETLKTLKAFSSARKILAKGGMISLTCYRGHKEGRRESSAILEECQKLNHKEWLLLKTEILNAKEAPFLLEIYKRN